MFSHNYRFWIIILFLLFFIGEGWTQQEKVRKYTHHTIDGFRNPSPEFEERKTKDLFKMLLWERLINRSPDSLDNYPLERVQNDGEFLRLNDSKLTVTWIGHSTLLLQIDGVSILTDPVWSERASPVSFAGPKRLFEPGMQLDDLPEIDIILISHNHYDHLDKKTIKHFGNKPMYIVPLGVGSFFESLDITRYQELDWWESIKVNNIEIISTPAQHFSGRNLFDRNKTLWCGWIMRGKTKTIYFAGDTGYFREFKEIGRRFGPIDIAALPIGSYEPSWYMEPVHMNPEQAVDAFLDVQGKVFIPIHWGTFSLGEEPINEPPLLLEKEVEKRGLDREDFWILKHGETRIFKAEETIKSEVQFSDHES